jgi:hypothetical protein
MMSIKLIKTGDLYFSLRILWRRLVAGIRWELWIYWFFLENTILINDSTLSCFLLHLLLLWVEWLIYAFKIPISNTWRIGRSVGLQGRYRANLAWRLRRYHFLLFRLFIQHMMTRLHVTLGLLARPDRVVGSLNPCNYVDECDCFTVEVPQFSHFLLQWSDLHRGFSLKEGQFILEIRCILSVISQIDQVRVVRIVSCLGMIDWGAWSIVWRRLSV